MNNKKAILALLAEIFSLMDGDPTPAKSSWPPKRIAPRNGSALVILSLILGILLGVLVAMVLKGCTMQNACIIGAGADDTIDAFEVLEALGGIDTDTDTDTDKELDASVF